MITARLTDRFHLLIVGGRAALPATGRCGRRWNWSDHLSARRARAFRRAAVFDLAHLVAGIARRRELMGRAGNIR